MVNKMFTLEGEVELFPGKGGWYFVRIPKEYTLVLKDLAERGLIPITADFDGYVWDTSLLPMGDGTHFLALNAKLRRAKGIELGNRVKLSFSIRKR